MNTTRRGFLRSTTAALVSASAFASGGSARAATKPGDGMRFGLVTYLWGRDWDLPTLIANCEKARVFGVELRTTHAHGVEPDLTAARRAEVKKRFEDSPVVLVGLGSNERFDSPDPNELAKAIEATKDFVKLSHDVGGSGVKVKPNSFHDGVPHAKTIEQIGKSLNEVGAFAADYGQEIRLEVHGECAAPPIMKRIMDVATHPSVGVCWNSNQKDLEGKGLEYNFNLLKDRFGKTAHVRELDSTNYPYQTLLELFVEMDYNGWVLLEASSKPADRVAALAAQKRLWEKMLAEARRSV